MREQFPGLNPWAREKHSARLRGRGFTKSERGLVSTSLALCSVLVCLSAAIAHQPTADALTKNLTSGSWVKTLGAGGMTEQYVYTFSKSGGYTFKLITDSDTKPVVGTWRLTKAKDGKTHLVLVNTLKQYYWLEQDSVIQYDRKRDALIISGKAYVGSQQLSRQRTTP